MIPGAAQRHMPDPLQTIVGIDRSPELTLRILRISNPFNIGMLIQPQSTVVLVSAQTVGEGSGSGRRPRHRDLAADSGRLHRGNGAYRNASEAPRLEAPEFYKLARSNGTFGHCTDAISVRAPEPFDDAFGIFDLRTSVAGRSGSDNLAPL